MEVNWSLIIWRVVPAYCLLVSGGERDVVVVTRCFTLSSYGRHTRLEDSSLDNNDNNNDNKDDILMLLLLSLR